MKSEVMHIRIPLDLKDKIHQLADAQRRPWTQMTVLLLRDAVTQSASAATKKSSRAKQKSVDMRV